MNVVLSSELLPAISSIFSAVDHAEKCMAWAAIGTTSTITAANDRAIHLRIFLLLSFKPPPPTSDASRSALFVR